MKFHIKVLLLSVLLVACKEQNQFDIEKGTKEILKVHNLQRDYHFNKDSISFANQFSENFVSINNGIISRPKKSETISRYNSYFLSVDFIRWDDVTEPIILFSDDGTLAYAIVDKIVKVTYKGETGEKVERETRFAWTTIYRKYGDEWKIDCVTSTSKPINS
ncbi:nuclear transport factor 2 family protein [Lentiprolixibacter aurantiacus]|uniref:Nuclear transport factor 2 family protein n=1 Tax=Lentiprolixibacter aurantiacus TaxID=2993939 RepID=A0AAE3SP60_9FLAO|nr:nuclear transport factor 2 family protein [Lentiprolixibacter aurantiacus]MCX2719177.1 nuclear transport factor 2 family protein [Lentiprolixibacter aurantiacus]